LAVGLIAATALAATLAFARSGPAAPTKQETTNGPFTVSAGDEAMILVDGNTGKTWFLLVGADGPVWVPCKRIDDASDGRAWYQREMHRKSEKIPAKK
jgi:hypothetical protein